MYAVVDRPQEVLISASAYGADGRPTSGGCSSMCSIARLNFVELVVTKEWQAKEPQGHPTSRQKVLPWNLSQHSHDADTGEWNDRAGASRNHHKEVRVRRRLPHLQWGGLGCVHAR